jgi:HAD superfamily hydrolase (TIGR01509 family)
METDRPAPARGIILDVDGTLVDSNDAHAGAWADALAHHGYWIDPARVRPLIGKGGDKVVPALTGLSERSPTGNAISKRRGQIFRTKYLPQVHAFRGARALVERLEREGLKIVVASAASTEDLRPLLDKAGVQHLVDAQTSKDDVARSKPDPDVVEAALATLGMAPAEVVMIGDTPYDVEAAARAGVRTIALRSGGGWSDHELSGAAAIYDDPTDLLAHLDTSPVKGSG